MLKKLILIAIFLILINLVNAQTPTVSISSPSEGQQFQTSSITVTGSYSTTGFVCDGDPIDLVEVKLNNGQWQTATRDTRRCTWSIPLTLTQEDYNIIQARSSYRGGIGGGGQDEGEITGFAASEGETGGEERRYSNIETRIVYYYPIKTCTVRAYSCSTGEVPVYSMYQSIDSHINKDVSRTFNFQLCCPISNVYSLATPSSGNNVCGGLLEDDIVVKAFNNGVDAHVNKPTSRLGDTNICLRLNAGVSGSITCNLITSGDCAVGEVRVASLAQQEDSHVGAYIDYSNKICCKVITCPSGFAWDGTKCVPGFEICLLKFSNGTVSSRELCKDEWRTPVNQNDPYWRDALTPITQDCFAQSETGGENAVACCFDTTYLGNTYGRYRPNVVIKRTIQEIQQQS